MIVCCSEIPKRIVLNYLQDRSGDRAMITIQHVVDNSFFVRSRCTEGHRLRRVKSIVNHNVIVMQFIELLALLTDNKVGELKRTNFKGPQADGLGKNLVEDLVLRTQINCLLPIPLILNELFVLHVAPKRHFNDTIELNHVAIESRQEGANFLLCE